MKNFQKVIKTVYRRFSYLVVSFSIFVAFSFLDFFLLTRNTTWERFLTDNHPVFVALSLVFSVVNNLLISIALTFFVYVIEERKKYAKASASNSLVGVFLSLVSVGCAVCGGFLLPLLGIAASLTAFPFQGLEIKVLSIILLTLSLRDLSRKLAGALSKKPEKYTYAFGLVFLVLVYLIPRLPYQIKSYFKPISQNKVTTVANKDVGNLFDEINPEKGYEINASYGKLGPNMTAMEVLDIDRFKETYEKSGTPLSQEQLDILTKGSDKKIRIDRENSYFLLNFFWAAGLGNKTKILTEGDMVKYGKDQVGNFASTGGWSLAKGDPMNYYAKGNLIPLTSEQENLVEKVSTNIYRPCCNNSTAFPDCNHGMALLAVLELIASQGSTENQLYEAGKYFNAYWFPGNYYDIALYFKNKEGKNFREVPGQVVLSKEYSSSSGARSVKQWLVNQGIQEAPPKQGGGCGI